MRTCHHAPVKAVRCVQGAVEVVDVPEPVAGADEVIVHVERAGVCGSDLHMISEGWVGVTLGHEFAGRLDDGRRVAIRPTGACGNCGHCSGGRINLCSQAFGAFHGGVVDGGWAERVAVHRSTVYEVPSGVSLGGAALAEPIAVAVHGVRRAALKTGHRVAVIGGGSVGLAVVAALGHMGWSVDVEARYRHQQQATERLGAHVGLSGEYDVVFDAVGTQSAVESSVRACRSGGTIVELGVFWEPITLGRELTLREISLVPALFYAHDQSRSDFETALDIVESRPDLESILVTHRFPLEEASAAIRTAQDRSSGALKVHLRVGD